jgi:hypothetical protein
VAVVAKALLQDSAAIWITALALFTAIKHQNQKYRSQFVSEICKSEIMQNEEIKLTPVPLVLGETP